MILLIGLVTVVAIIAFYKWRFTYWKNKNLVCFEEPTIPFGNVGCVLGKGMSFGTFCKQIYDKMKRKGYKHAGAFVFTNPVYFVNDLEIMKTILQRRFDYFSDRLCHIDETDHPFEQSIVLNGGEKWRYLRTKLSPAFTPGKMKAMLDIIVQCGSQMLKSIDCGKGEAININKTALCYITDVIGSCAFGVDCNSYTNPNSDFIKHGKLIISVKSKIKKFKIGLKITLPQIAKLFRMTVVDTKSYQFFLDLFKDTVKFRKYNNVGRKDLLQLLLEAEPDLNVEEIDNESSQSAAIIHEITAQAMVLHVAGFDTSSTTLMLCLFEIASNLDVQHKVINEIDQILAKYEGKITYEAVTDMKYVRQVVDETLRKYPPVPFISRRSVKSCEIDDTGVIIDEGTIIFMSILGIHHDPEYYPDPEIFDPERFSEENKKKRVPFTYLPFGEGPRNCPAFRFGLLQIKVGLTMLLQKYRISVNKRTELPIKFDTGNFTLVPETEIWLDITSRKR